MRADDGLIEEEKGWLVVCVCAENTAQRAIGPQDLFASAQQLLACNFEATLLECDLVV